MRGAMMYLIERNRFGEFAQELAAMHRLRHRVFKERLGWEVTVSGKSTSMTACNRSICSTAAAVDASKGA